MLTCITDCEKLECSALATPDSELLAGLPPLTPMAPKKKVLKAEAASELQDQDQDQEADSCNEKLIIRTVEAMAVITGNPLFADIVQALPLAPFNFKPPAFSRALKAHGTYICGGNLFWTKWAASRGVPIHEFRIDI